MGAKYRGIERHNEVYLNICIDSDKYRSETSQHAYRDSDYRQMYKCFVRTPLN